MKKIMGMCIIGIMVCVLTLYLTSSNFDTNAQAIEDSQADNSQIIEEEQDSETGLVEIKEIDTEEEVTDTEEEIIDTEEEEEKVTDIDDESENSESNQSEVMLVLENEKTKYSKLLDDFEEKYNNTEEYLYFEKMMYYDMVVDSLDKLIYDYDQEGARFENYFVPENLNVGDVVGGLEVTKVDITEKDDRFLQEVKLEGEFEVTGKLYYNEYSESYSFIADENSYDAMPYLLDRYTKGCNYFGIVNQEDLVADLEEQGIEITDEGCDLTMKFSDYHVYVEMFTEIWDVVAFEEIVSVNN